MSTAPASPSAPFTPGIVARAIAAFSGTPGLVIKIALLALDERARGLGGVVLVDRSHWVALAILVAATAAIDFIYLVPRSWTLPAKFLVPGTIFLLAFQLVPIIYTIEVAFSNYSTGHITTKAEAIKQIKINSLEPPPNGKQYEMAPARDAAGNLVLILHDDTSGKVYAGTKKGLTPLAKADVKLDASGIPTAAKGYTLIKGAELFTLDTAARRASTSRRRATRRSSRRASRRRSSCSRRCATTRRKNAVRPDQRRRSSSRTTARARSSPPTTRRTSSSRAGSRSSASATSTSSQRPAVPRPVPARLRLDGGLRDVHRLLLVRARALPRDRARQEGPARSSGSTARCSSSRTRCPASSRCSSGRGLLNDDFGVVNKLLRTCTCRGSSTPNWARVSVILVSVWLTTPYFFLVSLGALQSIPAELTEAAKVDGGGGWAIFRRVTLPLLLVAVAPLMIASFAFNFNNFNNIYLLTGGGPYTGTSSVAGSTDILISYTYKLAIATGKGQDYGLASAVAIIIFFIVATISGVSFCRRKSLENMR